MTLQTIKDDLGWSLYSKGSGIYNVYFDTQFQGQIRKVNTKFTVVDLLDGDNYPLVNTTEELSQLLIKWQSTLPFSANTYNPDFADGVASDLRVVEIMHKLGFEYSNNGWNLPKTKNWISNHEFKLSISEFRDCAEYSPKVTVTLNTGEFSWISEDCLTPEEVRETVVRLTRATGLMTIPAYLPFLEMFEDIGGLNETTLRITSTGFEITTENLKQYFIQELEKTLEILKK